MYCSKLVLQSSDMVSEERMIENIFACSVTITCSITLNMSKKVIESDRIRKMKTSYIINSFSYPKLLKKLIKLTLVSCYSSDILLYRENVHDIGICYEQTL